MSAYPAPLAPFQGQESGWFQEAARILDAGLEVVTLLLAFLLAIFVLLVFAVRVVMVVRKLPVPVDPLDMAKPRDFRTLMLGSAVALTPLVAQGFLPVAGINPQVVLVVAYALTILLAVALWFLLEFFYRRRARRSRPKR